MDSSRCSRRHCFIEQDNGLASIAVMETGHSRSDYKTHNQNGVFSRPLRTSLRNLSVSSSSFSFCSISSPRFEDPQPHFLDSCFLCKKSTGGNKDIFMYRDTPFCSEECRQEQMEIDEAKEKNQSLSSSMKALRKKDQRRSNSPTKAQNYTFRQGTVAAA